MKTTLLSLSVACLLLSCTKQTHEPQPTPPVANFTVAGKAVANIAITFKNTSVNAETYSWDFGDSTTSQKANPVHVYKKPGTYAVILLSYGELGVNVSNDVAVKNIKVDAR